LAEENVNNTVKREKAFKQLIEKNGGKLLSFLYTMGQFDAGAVFETAAR
jgi:uncharacterized protein with GYD domain